MFYSFDSEGNVAQRSDGSGSLLSNYFFSGHGSILSGTIRSDIAETGLQLLTHRYYDPNAGRFLTRDPISYTGGINLYSYSGNNPTNFMSPLGPCSITRTSNPSGSTVAITGRGVFSFGNGREMATDNKGNIIGGNVADYIDRESRRRETYLFIIKTTPLQDAAIAAALRFIAENEPALPTDRSIALDNCSTRSNRGLDAGNITNSSLWPAHHIPGSAGTRAMRSGSSPQHIPQGAGWLPTSLEQFMRK